VALDVGAQDVEEVGISPTTPALDVGRALVELRENDDFELRETRRGLTKSDGSAVEAVPVDTRFAGRKQCTSTSIWATENISVGFSRNVKI